MVSSGANFFKRIFVNFCTCQQECVWWPRDPDVCVTWLVHEYVCVICREIYICVWHIHVCDIYTCVTYMRVWYICVRAIYTCVTYIRVGHIYVRDIYMCVTYICAWHIYVCDIYKCVTYIRVWHIYVCDMARRFVRHASFICDMRWLRLVGSQKLQVSFSKEPYKRDHILQKRHIFLNSLLLTAIQYECARDLRNSEVCVWYIECVCDMARWDVWQVSFERVTWLICVA